VHKFRDRHPGYSVSLNVAQPPPAASGTLRVGFGRVKITPDLSNPDKPIWLAGFKQHRAATTVHDDLWAVACVIDDGQTRLGIAALDAIGFFHDDVVKVRQALDTNWNITYTIVCSTHNHSTPDLLGLWGPNYLRTGVNANYRAEVIAATAKAFGQAATALQPARLACHEIKTQPEGLVSDSRKPHVFDPDIRVMHFTNPTNDLTIGSIVGWASHPETVWSRNTEVTADFPGYLRDALEKGVQHENTILEPGLGGIHLYVNGAVGGLMSTPPSVTVRDPYLQQDFKDATHDKARALGRQLASRIITRIENTNAPSVDHAPISIRARTIEMPLKNKGYLLAGMFGLIDRGHVRWRQLRTEVALVSIGDATIACIPGEIYPELVNGGIDRPEGADFPNAAMELPPIRELMSGKIRFVFGLANDEIGYIIPKAEWDQKRPYLYGAKKKPYGEINSVGPEAAPRIHAAFRELCAPTK
jgi:hypothetical protein